MSDQSPTTIEVDPFLAALVKTAELSSAQFGVTLELGGSMISGTVVNCLTWLKEMERVTDGSDSQLIWTTLREKHESEPLYHEDQTPLCAHLVDVWTSTNNSIIKIPARVALSKVAAWHLGATRSSNAIEATNRFPAALDSD